METSDNEIWKDIPGYSGYQASNLGRIRSYNKITYTKRHGYRHWKDRVLSFKPSTNSKQKSSQGMGYRVDLWKNGKPNSLLVARLIATTFLENLIDTNMTVNHKNGNRLDNRVENLEWLSREDNIRYGFENGQYKQISCTLISTSNNKEYKFRSLSQTSKFIGRSTSYIKRCKKENKPIISQNKEEYIIKRYN